MSDEKSTITEGLNALIPMKFFESIWARQRTFLIGRPGGSPLDIGAVVLLSESNLTEPKPEDSPEMLMSSLTGRVILVEIVGPPFKGDGISEGWSVVPFSEMFRGEQMFPGDTGIKIMVRKSEELEGPGGETFTVEP